ncbi:unnamed protein product [Allacma fusca]|uniref:Uncharacterized protein n=1 Tax=Allacma fusca TaxID=39272 RepID=A0A8J2KYT2_9HEXA|nr:unnamed protein product [Allacma fusca]
MRERLVDRMHSWNYSFVQIIFVLEKEPAGILSPLVLVSQMVLELSFERASLKKFRFSRSQMNDSTHKENFPHKGTVVCAEESHILTTHFQPATRDKNAHFDHPFQRDSTVEILGVRIKKNTEELRAMSGPIIPDSLLPPSNFLIIIDTFGYESRGGNGKLRLE